MTIAELMELGSSNALHDPNGKPIELRFLPGLSEKEVHGIEQSVGAMLPADLRSVMQICAGIEGLRIDIDFSLKELEQGEFPGLNNGYGIANDGCGNIWYVDLLSMQEELAQIFFLSHDPPKFDYAYSSLSTFLDAAVESSKTRYSQMGDDLPSEGNSIAKEMPFAEALAGDPDLRSFAESLDDRYIFLDLRNCGPGHSIDFFQLAKDCELERHREQRIFAYLPRKKRTGLLAKLFGK